MRWKICQRLTEYETLRENEFRNLKIWKQKLSKIKHAEEERPLNKPQSSGKLWDNSKRPNIHIIEIFEGDDCGERTEKYLNK